MITLSDALEWLGAPDDRPMNEERLKAEMNRIKDRLKALPELVTQARELQDHALEASYLEEAAELQRVGKRYGEMFIDLRQMETEGPAAVAFVEELLDV